MRNKINTINSNVIDRMQRDALFAYLELMHATKNIPEKTTYENILQLKNAEALDRIIILIETEHGKVEDFFEEEKKKKTVEKSLFQRIFRWIKK